MIAHLVIALSLGFLLPASLLVARYAIRKQRLRAVQELTALLYGDPAESWGQAKVKGGKGGASLPQLEFLRSKYDLAQAGEIGGQTNRNASRYPAVALMTCATLFGLVCAAGFFVLMTPLSCMTSSQCSPMGSYILAPVGELGQLERTLAIIGAAFVGAYIGAALYLSRRVLNFELHALAFMRVIIGILIGVLIALIAYRALNGGADFVAGLTGQNISDASPGFWLGVAFFIGLAPEAGLTFIARKLNLQFRKELDTDALAAAKVVPTEAIDGIDSEIAYRLQESGIYDVQNLATYNPLQLYVETPFGLMQCFDWVLQAQLVVVVGSEAFFKLKACKIRTTFDLERAVLACGVPEAYIVSIGKILFADVELEVLAEPNTTEAERASVIRHCVAVMTDDLHVHRLRSVWTRIRDKLSGESDQEWLYLTVRLPGEAGFPGCEEFSDDEGRCPCREVVPARVEDPRPDDSVVKTIKPAA